MIEFDFTSMCDYNADLLSKKEEVIEKLSNIISSQIITALKV